MAGYLLGIRRREGARAPASAAGLGDAAEGDRTTRGRDRPVRAVGILGAGPAKHQAGEEQAATDRPDGQGRAAGLRAPEDGPRASPRRTRWAADPARP